MSDNDNKQSGQFDASLPLPIEDAQGEHKTHKKPDSDDMPNPAADLVRKRLDALYAHEPDAKEEVKEVDEIKPKAKLSKHQQFIYDLTSKGKSLHDIQTAWHEYYAGLTDKEKHEVWHEFYNAHSRGSHYGAVVPEIKSSDHEAQAIAANQEHILQPRTGAYQRGGDQLNRTMSELKGYFGGSKLAVKHKSSINHYLRSLAFGLAVGSIVLLILLFGLFNDRIIAPFIQPSRNVTNTPIISTSAAVGPNPEVIIPKINVEIPVVYNVTTISDTDVENALENGVVHYADTAMPGEDGNVVIVGHSSNNIFNPGRYKFAFVLLSRLEKGDTFYLLKDGKRYTYQIYDKKIVGPNDVSVLGLTDKLATATLITCDPPGTSINRLVVIGEQIDPNPATNTAAATKNTVATSSQIIPGNSPSLWSRILRWLEQ